jgi:hypothetical protein
MAAEHVRGDEPLIPMPALARAAKCPATGNSAT